MPTFFPQVLYIVQKHSCSADRARGVRFTPLGWVRFSYKEKPSAKATKWRENQAFYLAPPSSPFAGLMLSWTERFLLFVDVVKIWAGCGSVDFSI